MVGHTRGTRASQRDRSCPHTGAARPNLPFPYSSGIKGSRHAHMRELRVESGGKPLRVFYAFDPRRMAILLIGGDKTGDKRIYDRMVPLADDLYDEHLAELAKEKDDGR